MIASDSSRVLYTPKIHSNFDAWNWIDGCPERDACKFLRCDRMTLFAMKSLGKESNRDCGYRGILMPLSIAGGHHRWSWGTTQKCCGAIYYRQRTGSPNRGMKSREKHQSHLKRWIHLINFFFNSPDDATINKGCLFVNQKQSCLL